MVRQVKRRTIDSPLRREQAAQTRQRILAAARRLFISRGYMATTMSAIATEAGVAVETVYASAGAKPVILATLTDQVVAGDDPASVSHRERVKRLLAEQAPAQWLGAYADEVRGIQDRWADMYTAMRHATAADPQIAALWADKMQARLDGIRPLAAALADRGMLAPGITADRAADVIWTLGSPETYQLLVSDRGWDPGDYQEWLTRTLEQALLPPAIRRTAPPLPSKTCIHIQPICARSCGRWAGQPAAQSRRSGVLFGQIVAPVGVAVCDVAWSYGLV